MYLFWKYVHIVGVLGFVAAHGATAAVTFRLRKESDRERVGALLDLSRSTRTFMYVSLLVLVAGGIETGFALHVWGRTWIWAAIGLLVLMLVAAFPLAVPYYSGLRRAVEPGSGVGDDGLAAMLASPRPLVIAAVETAGILVIVWLMIFKPV